jgi:hypothetical protein
LKCFQSVLSANNEKKKPVAETQSWLNCWLNEFSNTIKCLRIKDHINILLSERSKYRTFIVFSGLSIF